MLTIHRGVLAGCAAVALAAALPGSGHGQVSLAEQSSFSGATALTFEEYTHGTLATSLYPGSGVSFTRDDGHQPFVYNYGAIGRTLPSGTNVLSTSSGAGAPSYVDHINLVFSSAMNRVGAFFGNDDGMFAAMILSVYDGGDQLIGSVRVEANHDLHVNQFIGLESATAFSRARFQVEQPALSRAVAIDDVVFAGGTASVAPEPVSMALLGTGLAGVAALRRRRKAAEAETA